MIMTLWCFGELKDLSTPYCDTCPDIRECYDAMRAREAAQKPKPEEVRA